MSEEGKKDLQPADSVKGKKSEKSVAKEKAAPKKQSSFVKSVTAMKRWGREMKSELKKVLWPTRSQTIQNTLIVLVCVVIVGVFIWAFDGLAGLGVQALIDTVKG